MEISLAKAYAEVDIILSFMERDYVEKIPLKMRKMFNNQKLKNYEPNIEPKIPLDKQNLQRKTLAILAMLNLNYWCENEEEKQKLLQNYVDNDIKREQEIREIYNPEALFKNKVKNINIENMTEITDLIEYKEENIIKKVLNKIKKFFMKS